MDLNRWQRIGVGLCVIWAVAAFFAVTKLRDDRARIEVAITRRLCEQTITLRKNLDCAREEAKTWGNWTNGTISYAIAVAIFPIPFGWAFGEFIARLVASALKRQ
jgi:hypothetical protein